MQIAAQQELSAADVEAKIDVYAAHLRAIEVAFNDHAEQEGLGVRLDASGLVSAIKNNRQNVARAVRFCDREDDSGVLHKEQLLTALDCVVNMLIAPEQNGLVLGAMQSGKTTTSIGLQFAGPILHLLTGRRLYPIYLITSHTSQEDQTTAEIGRFLDYYGDLAVVLDENRKCTLIEYVRQTKADPVFLYSPTVNTYRDYVLKDALRDTLIGPRLDDFIARRVRGESIKRVADMCRLAASKGYAPLLIIDEPQFGASDRLVKVDDGVERRPCVLVQLFNKIDEALGDDAPDRVFIGLSATPFELHDVSAVWEVKQYLNSDYSGFNYFGGTVIDADAVVTPPRTISFGAFGAESEIPFLGSVNLQAYDADAERFERFAKKIGYAGSQEDYRRKVEDTLRQAILYMAKNGKSSNCGICLRLFNNNARSQRLIQSLYLPRDQIEVLEYFGSDHHGQSVKRSIRNRARPDLPFVIAVTNRARMGDAFPQQVEWFLEFSKKAANLNALLQGLLGRACGYGKNSTVIMSDENIKLVDDYKRTDGGYIALTSPHSKVVGPYRRGAPTNLIRIHRGMDDPIVAKFFKRVDEEIVEPHIFQDKPKLSTKRGGDARTGPFLKIAEEIGLFEHLESKDVRKKLFGTYPQFRIARAGDEVVYARTPGKTLGYALDGDGNCRFTFREITSDNATNHGGIRSRGYGKADASDRARAGDKLEPQINMRKFNPATGEPIDDKRAKGGDFKKDDERVAGNWRAEMITLPLVQAVREVQPGKAVYPIERSVFSPLLNDRERGERDYA